MNKWVSQSEAASAGRQIEHLIAPSTEGTAAPPGDGDDTVVLIVVSETDDTAEASALSEALHEPETSTARTMAEPRLVRKRVTEAELSRQLPRTRPPGEVGSSDDDNDDDGDGDASPSSAAARTTAPVEVGSIEVVTLTGERLNTAQPRESIAHGEDRMPIPWWLFLWYLVRVLLCCIPPPTDNDDHDDDEGNPSTGEHNRRGGSGRQRAGRRGHWVAVLPGEQEPNDLEEFGMLDDVSRSTRPR